VEHCSKFAAVVLLVACAGTCVWAQERDSPDAKPTCTDLSGTVTVPCPAGRKTTTLEEMDAAESDHSTAGPRPAIPASREQAKPVRPEATLAGGEHSSPVRPASIRQPIGVPSEDSEMLSSSSSGSSGAPAASLPPLEPEPVSPPPKATSRSPERALVRNLVQDQKDIWTSPLRLRLNDVQWLAPLLGAGIVTGFSDTDIQRHLPTSATLQTRSKSYSTYGVAAFAGATGAAWLWGRATHNDHLRETGILSGEAALDSFALTYAIKTATQRDRPYQGNGHGTFFSNGDSFPSEHAVAAWSMATVIAHEYPGPFTTLLAYGGAAAVSALRVTGRQHFTSDALVGSALGYFVGRHVYNAHHDGEDLARYGTFERSPTAETPRSPENMGSAFVPLDSWVYGAFDRLAALGYIHTAFAGLRPWTRLECLRLVDEAGPALQESTGDNDAALRLFRSLQAEFALDAESVAGGRNLSAELESLYTRFTGISGKPLNDSDHFGQTTINDYGRPYQEGFNMVSGFSARAEAGPLAFYVRGEYQHAPSAPGYPLSVRNAIAVMDSNPVQPSVPFGAHDDFQLLDTYVALNIKNNQISFGRQSTWWGPGQGGALMFSDNALPFYSLRWTQVSPFKLPSFLAFLGPVRTDMFLGRLEGHHFPGNPYISAQKFSFKPTENLEFGFSKISIFAGGGHPLTWYNFYKSSFSINDSTSLTLPQYLANKYDVGDHRGGFDFSYRLPRLRNWLTLYSDSLVDDDPSPLAAPRRAAINPGIYLSHVPGLPKLDFRAEAVNTDPPSGRSFGGQFIYWELVYHDSHTNAGNLMGSWIGREGKGVQAWSTYWLSGQNRIRVGYRNADIAKDFVPGGGHLNDFSAQAEFQLRRGLTLSGRLQYERWNIPLLEPLPQTNVTGSVQLVFRPAWRLGR
jgi:membrane-associated phospholipid phosphatase